MSESNPRRYSSEQVNTILRRALERQGGGASITHDELIETARELGIDPALVNAAINDQASTANLDEARTQWLRRRKQKFFGHLWSYVIVNAFFLIIALFTGTPAVFFVPLICWGVGLAFDARITFFPSDERIEYGARYLIEEREREEWRSIRRSLRKQYLVERHNGKIVIEKGDKGIEMG
jgi:hypothetical protein